MALDGQLSVLRSGVEGGEKEQRMCHKPSARLPPTSPCIPYVLSEASFPAYYNPPTQFSQLGSSPVLDSCGAEFKFPISPFCCCKPPASCFDVLVSKRHLPKEIWLSGPIVKTGSKKFTESEKYPVQLSSCGWTGG